VLEPGWARVNGERWRVRGDAAPGDEVVVRAVQGLTLEVSSRHGDDSQRG
jgi:membrane protein implicated in regulation of membrane protease activity